MKQHCSFVYPLPRISNQRLEKIFAAKVLAMLIKEKAISKEIADKILSWKHSGFSAYTDTLIQTDDENGLTNLAEYTVKQYCFAVLSAPPSLIKN